MRPNLRTRLMLTRFRVSSRRHSRNRGKHSLILILKVRDDRLVDCYIAKLVDVMKAIPLSEIPQSFIYHKNHPNGKSNTHRVIDNTAMKERQYWA
jgi:hypothetical protein